MHDLARILVVDDEKHYLDILVGILQNDYRIIVAKTGEEALTRLKGASRPDLILLDVLLPGIDGYDTCRQIKQDPTTRDIPLIFLTARSDVEDETLGLGLGAVDYIVKPISPPTVKARIHTHLALRNAQRELERQNQSLEDRVRERTVRLRRLTAELVLAEERERRRIAQALHDGPTQRLVLAKLNLGRLHQDLGERDKGASDVISALDLTLKELRTLMVQLSPLPLYELGLGPAVEWLAETLLGKQGIQFRVDSAENYGGLNEETRVFLFQAIRELMINIVKHAQATRASVAIHTIDGELMVEIRDDGIGMREPSLRDPQRPEQGGFGLFALRNRIDMLGGRLLFERDGGTRVTLRVPVSAAEVDTCPTPS